MKIVSELDRFGRSASNITCNGYEAKIVTCPPRFSKWFRRDWHISPRTALEGTVMVLRCLLMKSFIPGSFRTALETVILLTAARFLSKLCLIDRVNPARKWGERLRSLLNQWDAHWTSPVLFSLAKVEYIVTLEYPMAGGLNDITSTAFSAT